MKLSHGHIALHMKIIEYLVNFITALHAMQTQSSDENSFRPSVCPTVCPSVCPSHAWIV